MANFEVSMRKGVSKVSWDYCQYAALRSRLMVIAHSPDPIKVAYQSNRTFVLF